MYVIDMYYDYDSRDPSSPNFQLNIVTPESQTGNGNQDTINPNTVAKLGVGSGASAVSYLPSEASAIAPSVFSGVPFDGLYSQNWVCQNQPIGLSAQYQNSMLDSCDCYYDGIILPTQTSNILFRPGFPDAVQPSVQSLGFELNAAHKANIGIPVRAYQGEPYGTAGYLGYDL